METKKLVLISTAVVAAVVLIVALMLRSRPGAEALTAEIPVRDPVEYGGDEPITGEEIVEDEPAARDAPALRDSPATPPDAGRAPEPDGSSFLAERNRRTVTLFFQEADGDLLAAEKRRIFETDSPTDQAKQIVVELINGPDRGDLLPTVPPETRVLGLFIDRQGTAYVDLSEDVVAFHPGGTAEELTTIFSLVNSLTYNLDAVKRVRILVGGDERETLKNHLDLTREYRQDMSIVDRGR